MNDVFSDSELEQYLARSLSPGRLKRLEAALPQSPDLQARLEKLREAQKVEEEVRDSFAIRMPPEQEEEIRKRSVDQISSEFSGHGR